MGMNLAMDVILSTVHDLIKNPSTYLFNMVYFDEETDIDSVIEMLSWTHEKACHVGFGIKVQKKDTDTKDNAVIVVPTNDESIWCIEKVKRHWQYTKISLPQVLSMI